MAEKTSPVSVRLAQAERDLLDALTYLRGKSANEILQPVVAQYLRAHANEAGVKEAVAAKEKARRTRAS